MSAGRPDADRLAVWRSFLTAHHSITRELERELRLERSLPLNWYEVLLVLQEAKGRLRMHELAERMVVNKSSLTRLIDRMEQEGLVARESCPDDGRGWFAVITPDGRDLLRRAAPTHLRGIQEHFARHLSDADVAALARALAKLPGAAPRA